MNIKYKGRTRKIERGLTVREALAEEIKNSEYEVIGCLYNNDYRNLETQIEEGANIELIDISSKEGMKIYVRTIVYIMGKAFESLYPKEKLMVEYQLGNAMYCKCDNIKITKEFTEKLKQKMQEIIEKDLPIKKVEMTRKEAQKFYDETDTSKGRLQFDFEENDPIYMYYCEKYYNYCFGTLANRTGVIKIFDVVKYANGFLIRYPSSKEPTKMPEFQETKKLAWALEEFEKIHSVLDVLTVYKLNKAIEEDRIKDVIMLAEALHEKKIANIADDIAKRKNVKMVLIAGPSSSGKTTFAQRLGLQLQLNGLKPVTISVDNYFVEREQTPLDSDGKYDFEAIEAVDMKLLNEHIERLLNGEEVEMPTFNFTTGSKEYKGNKVKLGKDDIIVMEGIHCLNDRLTAQIPRNKKFKVYISALTVLNIDEFNRISTTDSRLIRRIVRDSNFRSYSAIHTLKMWNSVNRGELKNIFPFQEEADAMFNTSLIYEICVLKKYALPQLEAIDNRSIEFSEAKRIREFLKYFEDIPDDLVPTNSLLREFIGGGDFKY